MSLELRETTDAIVDALTIGLASFEYLIGDGEAPPAGGWSGAKGQSRYYGYAVVHPLIGGSTDGPIDAPDDDAQPTYQINCVGATRAHAEEVGDAVRDVLLAASLTVSGRVVQRVSVEFLGGSQRDDTVQPAVWFTSDRFRVFTTPGPVPTPPE